MNTFWIIKILCLTLSTEIRGTTQPEIEPSGNVSVIVGEPAMLPCYVNSLGSHSVAWLDPKNAILSYQDRRVVDDFRYSVFRPYVKSWNLLIQDVKETDSGFYRCSINTVPVLSASVYLDVKGPPVIHDQLSSQNTKVIVGDELTLLCTVKANPEPVITWYKTERNGNKIKCSQTGAVFNKTTDIGDSGIYGCFASNGIAPNTSRSIFVTVFSARAVAARVHQQAGKATILSCVIMTGNPLGMIAWYRGLEEIRNGSKYHIQVYLINHKEGFPDELDVTLKITDLAPEDFGYYRCVHTTDIGNIESKIQLIEYTPSNQLPNPAENQDKQDKIVINGNLTSNQVIVKEGDNIYLACPVESERSYNMQWTTPELKANDGHCDIKHFSKYTDEVVLLPQITRNCSGTYTCSVLAKEVLHDSKNISIQVHFSPEVTTRMLQSNEDVNTITLICIVNSNPPPVISWIKNDTPVRSNKHHRIYYNTETKLKKKLKSKSDLQRLINRSIGELFLSEYTKMSHMKIKINADETVNGEYICKAKNYLGTGSDKQELTDSVISTTDVNVITSAEPQALQYADRCEEMRISLCVGLGYTHVQMPNFLHHQNSDDAGLEVHQFSPLIKTQCSPYLRKFLCSMYAPECREDLLMVPPCRSLCLLAQEGCAELMRRFGFSWPENIECERFPVDGRCISANDQTLAGSVTSTDITTAPTPRARQYADHCEEMQISLCQGIGYTKAQFPNFLNHMNSEEAGLEVHQFFPLVKVNCSPYLKRFLCSMYAPVCMEDLLMIPPCKSLCLLARQGCAPLMAKFGFSWPDVLACEILSDDGLCIPSENDATTQMADVISPTPTPQYAERCEEMHTTICTGMGYTQIQLPNFLGHTNNLDVTLELNSYVPLIQTECSTHLKTFLCSLYTPECRRDLLMVPPCKQLCVLVKKGCAGVLEKFGYSWPDSLECYQFPNDGLCIGSDEVIKENDATTQMADVISPTPTPQYAERCEEMHTTICTGMGYTQIQLPNFLGHTNNLDVTLELNSYVPLIQTECSTHLKTFLCSLYTPECRRDLLMVPPCKQLCVLVKKGCAGVLEKFGYSWPDSLECYQFPNGGLCIGSDEVIKGS